METIMVRVWFDEQRHEPTHSEAPSGSGMTHRIFVGWAMKRVKWLMPGNARTPGGGADQPREAFGSRTSGDYVIVAGRVGSGRLSGSVSVDTDALRRSPVDGSFSDSR